MKMIRWMGAILGIVPFFLLAQAGQDHTIRWMSWNEGYPKAIKEGKVLFVFSHTDWCGWCRRMDMTTFRDRDVVDFLNRNVVAVRFNPEKRGEYEVGNGQKVDGRTLLRMLSNNQRSGYPTHFFLLPATRQIFREPGYRKPSDFLRMVTKYVGLNKRQQSADTP